MADTREGKFVPLELPDAGVQRYLQQFNIGAVYIIAGPAGFAAVGCDCGWEVQRRYIRRAFEGE